MVCIATRGRAVQLRRLLAALVEQEAPPAHIVVVDNSEDPDPEVTEAVRETAGERAILLHEPRPGIPYARNRGLEAALATEVPFIAFIDDDEHPEGRWPGPLVDVSQETGADVVVGPVRAVFPPGAPQAYSRSGIFDRRRSPSGRLFTAPTGNTVVRREVFIRVRPWFQESLAHVGGSDTEFFTRVADAGYRILECERGTVWEEVPAERLRLVWIIRRALRVGSLEESVGPERARTRRERPMRLLRGGGSVVRGIAQFLRGAISLDSGGILRGVRRVAWGAGRIAGVLGYDLPEYTEAQSDLTVLAFPGPGPSRNPYTQLLYEAVQREGVRVEPLSTRRALLSSCDILHVHWPESALRRAPNRPSFVNALQFVLLVTSLKLRGTKVVWTVHNLQPHEAGSTFTAPFLRWFSRRTDGWITLSRHAHDVAPHLWPALGDLPSAVVPHGHYLDAYPSPPSTPEARRTLGLPVGDPVMLFFGRLRGYKGVDDLLSAFALTAIDGTLIVAGAPEGSETEERIRRTAAADERVRLLLDFIDAERVPTLFAAADVVVLPFRDVTHSGSVMLALSLGRPVLVPDTPVMRELQEVVGAAWVITYRGSLGPDDLTPALELDRQEDPRGPDLAWADWSAVGRATARFFRQVAR